MDRTVLLSQWFGGPLPDWMPLFCERIKANPGLSFTLITDQSANLDCTILNTTLADYLQRAESIGARIVGIKSGYEAGCLRPLFASMYPELIGDSPWWGWCDLDIVVGNLDHFLDEQVRRNDLISFWFKVAGEFMLVRNCEAVNFLWRPIAKHLVMPMPFVEHVYSGEVCRLDEAGTVGFYRSYLHAHEGAVEFHGDRMMARRDGALHECPYFHFRKTKAWPL